MVNVQRTHCTLPAPISGKRALTFGRNQKNGERLNYALRRVIGLRGGRKSVEVFNYRGG